MIAIEMQMFWAKKIWCIEILCSFQDIKSKWGEVQTLVPQRDQTLEDELRKQQNNEALRRQFADKSNQVGPWIERQMDAVAAIGMGMQVSTNIFRPNIRYFDKIQN